MKQFVLEGEAVIENRTQLHALKSTTMGRPNEAALSLLGRFPLRHTAPA
jgi:hypothetical protein